MIEQCFRRAVLRIQNRQENTAVGVIIIRMSYFAKKYDQALCLVSFFDDNQSALFSYENGVLGGHDYSNNIVQDVYNSMQDEGYEEISEEEFMKIVDERYPGWRDIKDDFLEVDPCWAEMEK